MHIGHPPDGIARRRRYGRPSRDGPLSRVRGDGATVMLETGIGWLALFVAVAVLAALGLLAEEWGVDTRDDFASAVDRSTCH